MASPASCPRDEETLSGHQLVGLAFITEAAYLSITADSIILLLVLNNLRRHAWRFRRVFRSPLDVFILSLIISDLFQGLGSALIVRWIQLERVFRGTYCTIQGSFQSLGETSSAMATLVIAIYTFWVIAFRATPRRLVYSLIVVAIIWLYVIIFVVYVASQRGGWNEPDPYWCWIGHEHLAAQLAGEYLWLWIAGLASIVLYVPLFFILRGGCRVTRRDKDAHPDYVHNMEQVAKGAPLPPHTDHSHPSHRLQGSTMRSQEDLGATLTPSGIQSPFHSPQYRRTSLAASISDAMSSVSVPSVAPPTPNRRTSFSAAGSTHFPPNNPNHRERETAPDPDADAESETDHNINSTSLGLRILLYPVVYTALVLPLSIARWSSGFSTSTAHPTASRTTFVSSAIYYLSGFVNAFLVLFIRQGVGLIRPPSPEDEEESKLGLEDPEEEEKDRDSFAVGSSSGRRDRGLVGAGTSIAMSGTASGSGEPAGEQVGGRPRRKMFKSSNDDPTVDLTIRTVLVRGETGLPD